MSGAEFLETRKMLIKTLHMITEDLPLYTFFNRVRQFSLADLKKQCAELCIMADEKTPATARFKATVDHRHVVTLDVTWAIQLDAHHPQLIPQTLH